jgi:choice-of-anchor C domain-containing protein
MKSFLKAAAATAVMAVGASNALAANLLVNGSFEVVNQAAAFPAPHGFSANFGSAALPGWSIIGDPTGNIDIVVNPIWINQDGTNGLDLEGSPGSMGVSQAFATTIGSTYLVSYWMASNPSGGANLKTMSVEVFGNATLYLANPSFDSTGRSLADMGWRNDTFTFTADSAIAQLTFVSTTGNGFFGPALDNVSVEQVQTGVVPVPAALPLMAGGLGLLGWVARRRMR